MPTTIALVVACDRAPRLADTSPGADRGPVIDMHMHAHSLADYGGGSPGCAAQGAIEFPGVDPRDGYSLSDVATCPPSSILRPPPNDEGVMRESLAMLDKHRIVAALTTGTPERIATWRASSDRVMPATAFTQSGAPSVDSLRRLVDEGRIVAFAEVSPQYDGVTLDDPRFEPFFALAEELDVPVGVHLGEGPPGGPHVLGGSPYRAKYGSPFQLEDVLVRHPKLRLWVMHYGSPLVDEMIAVLYSHPQVYVDIAQNDWGFPRAHFYAQLKRLVDAGFAKRIMWGSDQMIWPDAIPVALETIDRAPFLTADQKRDIFYRNAARFLRFTPERMAKDQMR